MFGKELALGIVIIFLLCGCSSPLVRREIGKSYLILDAKLVDGAKQPKWIGLANRRGVVHISTGGVVAELDPGIWIIDNFGYGKSAQSGADTRHINSRIRIRLEGGKIHYLGMLALSNMKTRSVHYSLVGDPNLLQRACGISPELFEKYSMKFLFRQKEPMDVDVDCDGITTE